MGVATCIASCRSWTNCFVLGMAGSFALDWICEISFSNHSLMSFCRKTRQHWINFRGSKLHTSSLTMKTLANSFWHDSLPWVIFKCTVTRETASWMLLVSVSRSIRHGGKRHGMREGSRFWSSVTTRPMYRDTAFWKRLTCAQRPWMMVWYGPWLSDLPQCRWGCAVLCPHSRWCRRLLPDSIQNQGCWWRLWEDGEKSDRIWRCWHSFPVWQQAHCIKQNETQFHKKELCDSQ
jgi:hypothetical protein